MVGLEISTTNWSTKQTQQKPENPKNESATKTCIRLHEMTTPLLRFYQKYRKYDKISENPTQKSQSRGDDNLWGEHFCIAKVSVSKET